VINTNREFTLKTFIFRYKIDCHRASKYFDASFFLLQFTLTFAPGFTVHDTSSFITEYFQIQVNFLVCKVTNGQYMIS